MTLVEQLPSLAKAVSSILGIVGLSELDLDPLPTSGLAHDHVRVGRTGLLLRVPRQSQLGLDASANLLYQAACFRRMEGSGHTPRLHGVIDPSEAIPMGALVVEEILGAVVTLPKDLPAVASALAAIHSGMLPPAGDRNPLKDPVDPVQATLSEVRNQAVNLDSELAPVSARGREAIRREIDAVTRFAEENPFPPKTLISFDAHPGNFILDGSGQAILVDLEKGRYGGAGFDLAHATLYTSTTWDVATYAELSPTNVGEFYQTWMDAVPEALSQPYRGWLLPMRRIMWLWSVTWCAKWAVESKLTKVSDKHTASSTEDWSSDNTDDALIAHVADRVRHYLSDPGIDRVLNELTGKNALTDLLAPS